jgi:hypothetical protein
MKQYKHIPTDTVAEIHENNAHYIVTSGSWRGYLPKFIVEQGSDWEEIKEPLFTTDDGVPICDTNTHVHAVHSKSWHSHGFTLYTNFDPELSRKGGWKYFSTKEARIRFIVENKPVLTFGELRELIDIDGWSTYKCQLEKKISNKITEKLKQHDINL